MTFSTATPSPVSTPARRRPVLRSVRVARIEDPGPRLHRVTLQGDSLQGFGPARPGAHIKLFFSEMPAELGPILVALDLNRLGIARVNHPSSCSDAGFDAPLSLP